VDSDHSQWQSRIVSKSGRDSTADRGSILPTVRQCLGVGKSRCKVRQHCILVGELVVWNDSVQDIMPFYKIRRYVTREGRRLGCAEDSAPDPEEHLMIVFHDILLWDNRRCIDETYTQRRQHLLDLVQPIAGRAEVGTQIVMDFTSSDSVTRLACQMAFALTQRWEGLVLKACQDPYVGADGNTTRYVKLKKDYIPGLGDSADLVVIGGRRDPSTAESLGLMRGSWTTFFLACRETGDDCHDAEAPMTFRIVGQVSRPSISVPDIRYLNARGRLSQIQFSRNCERPHVITELRGKDLPTHLFPQSAVVEVMGAGFDRPADARYLTLRFPRIVKVHHDRSPDDAVDFTEYQSMAEASCGMADHDENEYRVWLAKLGYENIDDESEAVTTPRTSQSQETESPDEEAQSKIDQRLGTKRRASVSLVPPRTSKRQKEASIEKAKLDCVGAPRQAASGVVKIPESQADAKRVGIDTAQEVPEPEAEGAISDN
jgi:DNA ligase-4